MTIIPLMIDVTDKKIVVVGGGQIAERRISSLLDKGPKIFVISPVITSTLLDYYHKHLITWVEKPFSANDVKDAFMIIVATNDSSINEQVIESAPKDVLINNAESAEYGNVQFPTQLKRGRLTIAISTTGASPTLAKKIKKDLAKQFDENYEKYVDFLYEARVLIKASTLPQSTKRKLLKDVVDNQQLFAPSAQAEWFKWFRSDGTAKS